jgi:hypothetical protein
MRALWSEIYYMCLNILSTSINLIYSNTGEIVQSVLASLSELGNTKQEENSSISINHLS